MITTFHSDRPTPQLPHGTVVHGSHHSGPIRVRQTTPTSGVIEVRIPDSTGIIAVDFFDADAAAQLAADLTAAVAAVRAIPPLAVSCRRDDRAAAERLVDEREAYLRARAAS